MPRLILVFVFILLGLGPLAAQDKQTVFEMNKDRFLAGATVVQDAPGTDDLFMAGEKVRSQADIAGSAHLAGRKVFSSGLIGKDAYAAGMDVTIEGKVAGDATLSGYTVKVGEVAGDLRISGANLTLAGPVGGYALIAGDEVNVEAVFEGDVRLMAREVEFSDQAVIKGKLTIYEEEAGEVTVPAGVVSEDRIVRRTMSEWASVAGKVELWSWRDAVKGFISGVFTIAVLAALIAAVVPQRLADLRRSILSQPLRNLLVGFLVLATVIGATILLMITGVGLLLAPLTLIVGFLGAFVGYVVGAYAIGVGILLMAGQPEPDGFLTRAMAAGVGALAVAIVGLVPILGWLVVLSIVFAGFGAIAIWILRPRFPGLV